VSFFRKSEVAKGPMPPMTPNQPADSLGKVGCEVMAWLRV